MSLPKYPRYRESGVDWVGKVPDHWVVAALRWICTRYSGGTPDKGKPDYWAGGTIPWLNSGAVNSERIWQPSAYITQEAFNNSSAKWIPGGSLVMALAGQGKTKGMVAQLMFASTCNQSMAALVPRDGVEARYLYWWLVDNYQNIRNMAGGDLRDGLNLDLLGSIPCPLPPIAEQVAIAAFLDRETAKIDALIAEQEKLISLLAEKQQSTIFQAVTRGLKPAAAMKDSGLGWLGKIPAHWTMRRLKAISPFITVGIVVNPSDCISETGLPFVYGGDISEGKISVESCRRIAADVSAGQAKTMLQARDLLTVRVGAPGVTAVVPEECEGGNCASVMLTRRGEFDSDWLCFAMNSRMVRFQVEIVQYGAAQEQFNISHAVNFWIATPPQSEQVEIASFLRDEITKLDSLSRESQRTVNLLRERRAALVAAAVTGQIDVQGAVQPSTRSPAQAVAA